MELFRSGVKATTSELHGKGHSLKRLTRDVHKIGAAADSWGHFNGTIAYLRIWQGVALDEDQISQLYAARIDPTPAPTFVPTVTVAPTPRPSPETRDPTSLPSSAPSSMPSVVPTSAPTNAPSAVPTVACDAGTYFDGRVCVACSIGRFQAHAGGAPWPRDCNDCAPGRFNVQEGQSECRDCAAGKLSSPDRSHCKDCLAGEYNSNNTECKF